MIKFPFLDLPLELQEYILELFVNSSKASNGDIRRATEVCQFFNHNLRSSRIFHLKNLLNVDLNQIPEINKLFIYKNEKIKCSTLFELIRKLIEAKKLGFGLSTLAIQSSIIIRSDIQNYILEYCPNITTLFCPITDKISDTTKLANIEYLTCNIIFFMTYFSSLINLKYLHIQDRTFYNPQWLDLLTNFKLHLLSLKTNLLSPIKLPTFIDTIKIESGDDLQLNLNCRKVIFGGSGILVGTFKSVEIPSLAEVDIQSPFEILKLKSIEKLEKYNNQNIVVFITNPKQGHFFKRQLLRQAFKARRVYINDTLVQALSMST